jgi:hypothetical protein
MDNLALSVIVVSVLVVVVTVVLSDFVQAVIIATLHTAKAKYIILVLFIKYCLSASIDDTFFNILLYQK